MSRDYTAEVAELEAAYRANRVANASIATEVRSKYRAIIADEIRRRKQEADVQFAHHMARVKARTGIPLNVIQDEVLHTRSWDRWTYWRDLAGIEPERVSVSAAKAAREAEEAGCRWEPFNNEFGFALVLTKAENDAAFSDDVPGVENGEVVITDIRVKGDRLEAWPDHPGHMEVYNTYWEGGRAMKHYATTLANKHRKEAE